MIFSEARDLGNMSLAHLPTALHVPPLVSILPNTLMKLLNSNFLVASWFISPILSGIFSGTLYLIVDLTVLRRKDPIKAGLIGLPIFYFFVIGFTTFAVIYQGSKGSFSLNIKS